MDQQNEQPLLFHYFPTTTTNKVQDERINFNIYRITVVQSHATDGQYKPAAESQTLHILSQPFKVVQTLLRKESVKILIIDKIKISIFQIIY